MAPLRAASLEAYSFRKIDRQGDLMKAEKFRLVMFLFIEAYLVRFELMTKKHMSSVIILLFLYSSR